MSYHPNMPIDYVQLLRELMKERESWARKREDADREFSRLSDLIRSTVKMLSPEERDQCVGDLIEHFDHVHSPGLTNLVRGAFGSGKEWLTPTQIRAYLGSIGFNFEKYKANPMASIHTTLRRMVPNEVECKIVNGQKLYRLKTVEHWGASMLEDVRGWLDQNSVKPKRNVAEVVVVKRRDKAGVQGKKRS
jgi:hypothetical protein